MIFDRILGDDRARLSYPQGTLVMTRAPFGPASTKSTRPCRMRALRLQPLEERQLMAADVPAPLSLDSPVVEISAEEQLLVEYINRARANPMAEAHRIGIDLNEGLEPDRYLDGAPSAPLAIRQTLSDAARGHSQAMLDQDFFSHTDPRDGSRPSDRAKAAGYPGGAGENIALNYFNPCEGLDERILAVHEQLFHSPGHRVNLLRPQYRDIGVGLAMGDPSCPPNRFEKLLVTEKFGSWEPWGLTGVVYDDNLIPDDFYSVGEGLAGVTIEAVSSEGESFRTITGSSGGYTLDLPAGTYTVTASGAALGTSVTAPPIVVNGANVKLDFRPIDATEPETEPWREFDVDGDGRVTALDALLVINRVGRRMQAGNPPDHEYADLTALHALRIINYLTREAARTAAAESTPGAGEGERAVQAKSVAPMSPAATEPTAAETDRHVTTFATANSMWNSVHARCFSPSEDWNATRFAV